MDCRLLEVESRCRQPEVIHPSLMPSVARHSTADVLAIRQRFRRPPKLVPRLITVRTSSHDVLSRVATTLALRDQVLRSAAKLLQSRAAAGVTRYFVGRGQPHTNAAVVAAPTLLFKGTTTMNVNSVS